MKLLTIDEAAAMLRLSPKTIRNWVYQRKIRCIKLGRLVRFDEAELNKWIAMQQRPNT